MNLEKGQHFGLIDDVDARDFWEEELLGATRDLKDLPTIYENWQDNHIEYNQKEVSNSSCVSEAGTTCLSNYTWERMELFYRKEKRDYFKNESKIGAGEWVGTYLSKGTRGTKERHNNNNEEKVSYFKIWTNSDLWRSLLKKGYILQSGFRGSSAYSSDKNADGKLDKVESIKDFAYGHSICLVWDWEHVRVVDSYAKAERASIGYNKYNTYSVEVSREKLLKNNVFFPSSYVFVLDKYLDKDYIVEKKKAKEKDLLTQLNDMLNEKAKERKMSQAQKDQRDLDLMKKLGIWNGKDWEDFIQRRHAILMMARLYDKLKT